MPLRFVFQYARLLAQASADFCSDAPLDNIVNIDPNGDLVLVVGANLVGSNSTWLSVEKTVAFRVDYKTLARNSSVFKTKFDTKNDHYKPGTSDVGWTEHLPLDSPVGLEFLFLVAHYGGFSKVPDDQSFQEVYEIVCMTVKYNMHPLLKGRAKSWLSTRSPQIELHPATSVKTLWQTRSIAIGLGDGSLVQKVTHHIVHYGYINNGHLTVNEEDLEENSLNISSETIGKLLSIIVHSSLIIA